MVVCNPPPWETIGSLSSQLCGIGTGHHIAKLVCYLSGLLFPLEVVFYLRDCTKAPLHVPMAFKHSVT